MMVVVYVDDGGGAGVGASDPTEIDKLIDDLRGIGFELTREGDLSKKSDGSIFLSQTGLIAKILKATHLEDCKLNILPASTPLGTNPDGPPMNEPWSYPSIIGMLLYLSTNTRCDIAFASAKLPGSRPQSRNSRTPSWSSRSSSDTSSGLVIRV